MIRQASPLHKSTATLALVLAGTLLAAGCDGGGSGGDTAAGDADDAVRIHHAGACPLATTTYGLRAFLDVGERLRQSGEPDVDAAMALAELPAWRHWRRSYEPETIPREQLGLTVVASALGREALPPELAAKRYRQDFLVNQAFVLDNRDRILSFLDDLEASEALCRVRDRVDGWVRPEAMPDTLKLDFLAFNPEIRLYEGRFSVDAGLAFVSGREQLVRLLAGTLYRKVEAIAGPDPGEVEGEAIVAQVLRALRNEGVACYLDDMPRLSFGNEHPALRDAAPVPERLCRKAHRALDYVDDTLARLFAQPPDSARDFEPVHRYFIGSRSLQATAWFMARVIADRLGEDRLQDASRSVAGFLRAYQEATTQKTAVSAERGSFAWSLQTAPAFRPEVYDQLQRVLQEAFEDGAAS